MKTKLHELKIRMKQKLDADSSFSGTYRGKVMRLLEKAIEEICGEKG